MKRAPARPSARSGSGDRGGFALLITVTLLAFLVLLLVSLASLTRVETQVAGNNQQLAQARQNALMALNIALGQLQKYTGPDQRVTATADLAAAADGGRLANGLVAQNTSAVNGTLNGLAPASATASVQSGTRWWTGVWGRAGASYATPAKSIYDETPSPVLLNWLVSGNENPAFTVDADGLVETSSADGRSTADTAPFTPGAPVNWAAAGLDPAAPANWTVGGYSNLEIKSSGQKAVLLVGPATAGVDPDAGGAPAADRYVVAPVKDIDVASSSVPGAGASGTTTVGRYAWWVGDEGVKASYTLADPHPGKNTPGGNDADAAKSRLRLMAASRSGIELIPGFSAYPSANDTSAAAGLGRVLHMRQAPLLDASLAVQLQRAHFHDLATSTFGVLSDTLGGGLRKDLTWYFELSPGGWNSSDLAGQGIIPAPWSPGWGGALGNAPKWDWLYSFYNTNPDVSAATLPVRPETATEVGVSPVITQFRLIVFTDPAATQMANPSVKKLPAGKTYSLPVRANVVFVLANPCNAILTAPAGALEFVLKNTDTSSTASALAVKAGGNAAIDTVYLLRNPSSTEAEGMLDTVRFVLPEISIPPGETITLSVAGNNGDAPLGATNDAVQEPVNTVQLAVNSASNPVKSTDYFTARTPLNFTTTAETSAVLAQDGYCALTLTLRESGPGHAVYQRLFEPRFSKPSANGLGSQSGIVFGSAQLRFIGPAHRDLDWSDHKSNIALFAYGRVYQDYNIRAGRVDPINATPTGGTQVLLTHPPYGGGILYAISGGTSGNLIFDEFKQDLLPAPWAENFGQTAVSSPTFRSNAGQGVLFDFPRRTAGQPPVISLGQLQHASLSTDDVHPNATVGYQSAYAVGNSYHHPHVTRGSSVQARTNYHYLATGSTTRYFDLAYLLNTALWDRFFFSGIPQSGAAFDPLNSRYAIHDGSDAAAVRGADSAAHLLVKGAFNINSTSHDAWVAALGGLNGLAVNQDTPAPSGTPFPRTLWQPVKNTATGDSCKSSGTGDDAYAGYRRLSATEIDALAAELVKRVRARGPFVSLSHFVNRSLVAASTAFNSGINDANTSGALAGPAVPMGRGLSGPLQAAIDAAGLNTFQTVGGDVVTGAAAGDYGDRVLFNGEVVNSLAYEPSAPSATLKPYFADKDADAPAINYDMTQSAPPGPAGRTSTAIPGWLLQGDVLQALGPALSARSDTFLIRAYGEVVNPADSTQKSAGAWCEAVVQRLPEYHDASGNSPETPPSALDAANKTFGRKYKIVSFRWLSAGDI